MIRGAVIGDPRRVIILIVQHRCQAVELAVFGCSDRVGGHTARMLAHEPRRVQRRIGEFRGEHAHIDQRFPDGALGDWSPLRLITCQQALSAPAGEHGGQLPADVHGIADPGVKPVSTPGRIQDKGARASPEGTLRSRGSTGLNSPA